uniref:CCHC-type domain-containing protein n=3 Tax=Meloidogyne TaxID=189290 RepID=A0A914LF01_MELIC
MIPHFSAVSTPPTTASMHQQSLMYTNQNQTGIQGAHQQPQPFVYQPQEGIPFQHPQTHFTLANTTDPNIHPTGQAWMLRTNTAPFFTHQQQPQQMSHMRHPQQSNAGQQPFVGGMQNFVLVPQTPPPMLPPTSICTNPYQPPQPFSIHGQPFQPQTGAIPTGSTTQYIRTFSNGGGGSGGPSTNANGAHINGYNPATHQQLRNLPPQQQQPAPNAVNTGIPQQPFGHQPVFMVASAMPNSAAPPPNFETLPPLIDRQFQQQMPMPSHQTSTAPPLLHQQLMQQTIPQMPPPHLHQQPPPQSAPPHHQSPQFQQQTCVKEKRPLSIQAPGSEGTGGEQQRDGSQSGRQSAAFSSNPSPQNQRLTPPTPANNVRGEQVKEPDNAPLNKTEEIVVGNDPRKRPQNRPPSFSNKNGVGQNASRGSFYNNNNKFNRPFQHQQSQDVRTYMQPTQNPNNQIPCHECGIIGHTWNYCSRIKRERDESIEFANLFDKQSLHPALKNGTDGNPFVPQNNYHRKSDYHQQQNFRSGGYNNKNFGQRHQRLSSGGGNEGSFVGGGNKSGMSTSGYTPSVRTSGYSAGSASGSVGRQSVGDGGGGGGRSQHPKHSVFFNKNLQKQQHSTTYFRTRNDDLRRCG